MTSLNEPRIDEFKQSVAEIISRKAPKWKLRFHDTKTPRVPLSIDLEHPLSNGRSYAPRREDIAELNVDCVERWIDADYDKELHDVAHAPEEIPHAELLRYIRLRARDFQWTNEVCATFAHVLAAACACIEPDEAEWLASFTGIDAPHQYSRRG